MKAIDLYAGVGGWTLGFSLAGIEIVKSYEWWEPAAATHHANTNSSVDLIDIRNLDFSTLPQDVDVVVGSPPCTQFSYSNRGGSGDIADGLKDIVQFLKVVEHTRPKIWAFENVPRVKKVVEQELQEGGQLHKFANLFKTAEIDVFDMAEFGVPQRRKRCIIGNFDFELFRSYQEVCQPKSLGEVVNSLQLNQDPNFSNESKITIFDNEREEILNWEETRFNRDMKERHPVYNVMAFPEPMERTSRTVTATCTRVSRESLIIHDQKANGYRRLSVRERASVQSFPVNFQFIGKSHSEKLKMVGNAIPPVFTYLLAEAIKGTPANELRLPKELNANEILKGADAVKTRPDKIGRTYPQSRRFRFAIPSLHFKSGTRFDLSNLDGPSKWGVQFYFGDSKRIIRRDFTLDSTKQLSLSVSEELWELGDNLIANLENNVDLEGLSGIQRRWSNTGQGLHPFTLVDNLEELVISEKENGNWLDLNQTDLLEFLKKLLYPEGMENLAFSKISKYNVPICIGVFVACFINQKFSGTKLDT